MNEARAAGVQPWHLRARGFKQAGPGVWAAATLAEAPLYALEAARCRLPSEAVFAGSTAAWLHGLDVAPCSPIEVLVPEACGVSGRVGMRVSRSSFRLDEVERRHGLPVTTMPRTLVDLGRRLRLPDSVAVADMALRAELLTMAELEAAVRRIGGHRNVARVRRMVELVAPNAESAMESRLRILLVEAGLPAPEVQVKLYAADGEFLARADLFYRDAGLVIEYDGETHKHTVAEDNRRQNGLVNAGYTPLRFTASDVLGNPRGVVAQVRAALAKRAA
ncbi:MAG: DUF559 domain-containing protein [Chloroflexi bacterium]|nr:MAG: DUF559 domain-containing protein [Chloroflexota bacterium]